ncbi:DUF4180 domain-containing protein [Metaclostridioides mangenotii]|uniref:DUF4180 domain-containing protein n=1 Tax=Metaclostridioides mangenotii TaxID=1540 RepID=UPI000466971E|nr:DUF4180 domain-containing protein [Clostridioides mangenotii]
MEFIVDKRGESKVVIVDSVDKSIKNTGDAMDIMASISYNYKCQKFVIKKENIVEEFFDLKTRLAGEILQKYTNYSMKVAIVGDFSVYESKSLKDFIYECNHGKQIFFVENIDDALDRLHSI